jgi:hypothetical protein
MNVEKEYIKLIFWAKAQTGCTNKNLFLFILAKITELQNHI